MKKEEVQPFIGRNVTVKTKEKEYLGSANRIIEDVSLEILMNLQHQGTWQVTPIQVQLSSIESIS